MNQATGLWGFPPAFGFFLAMLAFSNPGLSLSSVVPLAQTSYEALICLTSTRSEGEPLTPQEIAEIAQAVTVRLLAPRSPGSGVLIATESRLYSVLTAKHVIADTNPGEEIEIRTPDGQRHRVIPDSLHPIPGVDLALMQLSSSIAY